MGGVRIDPARQAPLMLGVEAHWIDAANDDRLCFSDGSEYLNFPGFLKNGSITSQTAFGQNYKRLADLKARYDPDNLFRLNQNIEPVAQTH